MIALRRGATELTHEDYMDGGSFSIPSKQEDSLLLESSDSGLLAVHTTDWFRHLEIGGID